MSASSRSTASAAGLADREDVVRAQAERDRRVHARHPAAQLAWINKIRLKYGPTMSLVDLSSSGVQIEIDDHYLQPESTVVVEIVRGATVIAVPSRVVRCQVTRIGPSIRYRGALAFKRLIELPAPPKRISPASRAAYPVQAHARLVLALRGAKDAAPPASRIVDPHDAPGDGLATLGADAMAATLAMLDAPASRRAGAPFARELSGLFNEVAQGVEQRESLEELTARVEYRLRRAVPARSIRITDGQSTGAQPPGADAVYFDARSSGSLRSSRILVDFPADAVPEEWQFQLLKASGHLVAVINEFEDRRQAPDASGTTGVAVTGNPQAQAGWNKLVVRFVDGRLLKGYCKDFHPARGHFHLYQSPQAEVESAVLVPIGHLKAVFFVRDFAGNPHYVDDKTAERAGPGRKVAVTFIDDELLVGSTLNYRMDGAGFVVTPCDEKSNNLRIFVSNRAVRHLKFL